ncbi:MAG: hypothetical protein KA797_07275 [Chitinophagales bacterium]|nr:hypothetical protein [Chitinophagales bacterium]
MKKQALDFIIDKLTDSILNTISGDSFQTEISLVTKDDLKIITKKNNWNFDWKIDYADINKDVYKVTIVSSPNVIQGLVSLSIKKNYIEMNLLESAPFNIGREKVYEGVAGNLVAFCCKLSFQHGFDGYVAFTAKTELIEHYKTSLNAYHFKGQRMIIESAAAKRLVEKYFKI